MAKVRNDGNPPPEQLRQLLVYDPDTGALFWRPRGDKAWDPRYAGQQAGTLTQRGYVALFLVGRRFYAHRIVWAMEHDEWPIHVLDHINGDKADNRLRNLRHLTQREHMLRGLRKTRYFPPRLRQRASRIRKTIDITTEFDTLS
jgi:hypothetical protein